MPPLPEVGTQRREQLAINLRDLDRVDATIRPLLLKGRVALDAPVITEPGNMGSVALRFICSLLAAGCACDTIRAADRRAGDRPTRVYLNRTGRPDGAWVNLPGAVSLTVMEDGVTVLNPAVFPPDRTGVVLTPPPIVGPVRLG